MEKQSISANTRLAGVFLLILAVALAAALFGPQVFAQDGGNVEPEPPSETQPADSSEDGVEEESMEGIPWKATGEYRGCGADREQKWAQYNPPWKGGTRYVWHDDPETETWSGWADTGAIDPTILKKQQKRTSSCGKVEYRWVTPPPPPITPAGCDKEWSEASWSAWTSPSAGTKERTKTRTCWDAGRTNVRTETQRETQSVPWEDTTQTQGCGPTRQLRQAQYNAPPTGTVYRWDSRPEAERFSGPWTDTGKTRRLGPKAPLQKEQRQEGHCGNYRYRWGIVIIDPTPEPTPPPTPTPAPEPPDDPDPPRQPDPPADKTPSFGSPKPTIANINAVMGQAITSVTLPKATGGNGSLTYSISPSLPTGLSFDSDPDTRVLSGSPTATQAATTYTYKVTDSDANSSDSDSDTLTFSITVGEADSTPTFGSPPPTIPDITGIRDQAITTVTLPEASGGNGSLTYSISPSLPTGLSFDSDPDTRVLSGSPTATQAATAYTYRVTDSDITDPDSAELTFRITVNTSSTVPGRPTGLRAARGNGQVTLKFTTPSDGGSAIEEYQYRLWVENGVYGKANTLDNQTKTITGLLNGRTYGFQVRAKNSVGEGAWSTEARATPSTVPGAPTRAAATAGDGRVTLAYFTPTNNGGATILGYQYQKKTATESWPQDEEGTRLSRTNTGVVGGLNNGTAYSFRVRAVNIAGAGAWSAPTRLVTPTAPAQPAPATLTVTIYADRSVVDLKGNPGLFAEGEGGTTYGVGTFTFQEKKFDEKTNTWIWEDLSGAESRFERGFIDVMKSDKGDYTFRSKLVAGGQTAYSAPIVVKWVADFSENVNNPKGHEDCSRHHPLSWERITGKKDAYSIDHYTEIWRGTNTREDSGDWKACIKARFFSATSGSDSVLVSGTLNHDQKKIKTDDSDVLANLRSDALTDRQLRDAYEFASVPPTRTASLPCDDCKGGFVETLPIVLRFKYLKTHKVRVNGSHVVDGRSLPGTSVEWEQPKRPLPTHCDNAVKANLIRLLTSPQKELSRLIVESLVIRLGGSAKKCVEVYRDLITEELKAEDLPPRIREAIIEQVTDKLIRLKGAQ